MILALAGGVGGAKLAFGLTKVLSPEGLIVAVNTGDDFDHLGLRICPDIDTVLYTLGNMANTETKNNQFYVKDTDRSPQIGGFQSEGKINQNSLRL